MDKVWETLYKQKQSTKQAYTTPENSIIVSI